jgi:hypothetical protein
MLLVGCFSLSLSLLLSLFISAPPGRYDSFVQHTPLELRPFYATCLKQQREFIGGSNLAGMISIELQPNADRKQINSLMKGYGVQVVFPEERYVDYGYVIRPEWVNAAGLRDEDIKRDAERVIKEMNGDSSKAHDVVYISAEYFSKIETYKNVIKVNWVMGAAKDDFLNLMRVFGLKPVFLHQEPQLQNHRYATVPDGKSEQWACFLQVNYPHFFSYVSVVLMPDPF